jgi:hypothetical protein
MAVEEKNIQIKDLSGNLLYPKTKGAVVINNNGDALGGVEAGAQVNIIESITVDGVAVSVANKVAAITLPTAAEYTVAKKATANTGFLATYELKKDGVVVGDAINIPKDFLVKSATLEVCETADDPVSGMVVGDPYLDFVINTKGDTEAETDAHIYIPVKDLVDVYTEGNGINIASNVISVDTTDTTIVDTAPTQNSTKFVQSGGVYTALAGKVNTLQSPETAGTYTKVTIDSQGLVTDGATLEASDIPNLTLAKITDVTATKDEVNVLDGITASTAELNILDGVTANASEINILDGATLSTTELNYVDGVTSNIQDQLDGKVNNLASAATAGTYCKVTIQANGLVSGGDATIASSDVAAMTSYSKANAAAAIATTDSLNDAIGKLEYKIDNALYYEVLS